MKNLQSKCGLLNGAVCIILILVVTFLGQAVSEDDYCSQNEIEVSTIKDRVMTDSSNRIVIIDDAVTECYGRIGRWVYYSTTNQPFKPGVWRWQSGNYWKLVGENTIPGTTGGYTIYDVDAADKIQFRPGDKIGFRFSSPALNYDKGFDAVSYRYAGISDYSTAHDPGHVYTVSSTDTKAYSIKAVFDDEDFTFDCESETHGPAVGSRSSNDGGNYVMVMTSLPFECYGQVKGWTYWAAGASGGFRPGIYRPVDGSTTQFTLISETVIESGHRLNEEVSHLIEDESEWLTYEPGDLIGWRWNSAGSRIRWTSSGTEIINMKYAGHDDNAYNSYVVGDTFTVSSDLNRAYSLQAMLSPFGYKGCFPDNVAEREMSVSSGHYSLSEMTRVKCISACGHLAYAYAGVQQGNLCLCSNSYGDYGVGNSTLCDYTCEGNQYFTCGGFLYNQIFTTPKVVKGYTLDPVDLQVTYEPVDLISNITRGTGVTYSFDYGDGFSDSGLDSGIYSHSYSEPRSYLLTGTATDLWLNQESHTIIVTMETNLTSVMVDCPPAVEYNVVFGCKFWVYQGTNMTAQVDFGDDRVVTFDIQDAETLFYGEMVEHNIDLNNQPTSRVFLKPNHYFKRDGYLVSWEFNAISTGTIYLQVYRPRCEATYAFCLRTFTCIKHWMDCQDHDSIFAKSCGDTGRYSFAARDCIKNSDNTLAGETVYTSLQVDYDFVSEYTYSITETGRNFIKLDPSDYVEVKEGDIIGWYNSNQGKLAYVDADAEVDGYEILPTTSNYGSRLSGSYIVYKSSGASAHAYKHALRAHVVRPSMLHVYHNYSEETNRREVTLKVNSSHSDWVSDNQTIKVQHVIKDIVIVATELAITTVEETLSVEPHPGTEVKYLWLLGNGDEIFTKNTSIKYTWANDGVYNITVIAYNDISRVIAEKFIVLQDTVKQFEWKDSVPATTWPDYPVTPKKFGAESFINFGMDEGTNVTFEINIGDGIVPTFFLKHDEELNVSALIPNYGLEDRMEAIHEGLTGSVVTIYESIGYYPVTINASNRVSWATINTTAVVQIEITNFRLVEPPPLSFGESSLIGVLFDTGTNLSFSGEFASNVLDLTNASLYYMNDAIGEGYIIIPPDKYSDRGFYDLSLTTLNLVSGPFTDVVTVQVEYAIKDLTMWVSEMYIMPHDSISIAFDMKVGSDLTMVMDFDDGESNTYEEIEMRRSWGDQFLEWHSYDVAADYNVTIHCTSAVSDELVWILIKVQNPVENVEMTFHSPGVIPYQEVGTILFEYEYTGDQSTPPTDANVAYEFTHKIKPVEDFPIAESNPVQQHMPLAKMGPYSVYINISNLVSFMVFEADIEMEKPILDLVLVCPRPHIRVGQHAEITASISWGSRVTWEWDFKDGSIVDIDVGGKRTRNHKYREPGIYPVSVIATNLLGSETYSLSSDPVVVQHPVKGFEWLGRRLNRLWVEDTYSSVPFHLYQAKDLPFPTTAYFTIDWGDGSIQDEKSLSKNGAVGSRNTDSSNHILTVEHDYDEWGQYNVTIRIWNLVSDKTHVFTIYIYETIIQLQKEVSYNEFIIDGDYMMGNDTENDLEGYGTLQNYFPLEDAIVVKATHASGTDLTYTWDFGDTFHVPDPTTEAPSTQPQTVTQSGTTTPVMTTTEEPLNCTFILEEWVQLVLDRLDARDDELLACSGGSIIVTPPPPTPVVTPTPAVVVNCSSDGTNCTSTPAPTTTVGPDPTLHYAEDKNCTDGIIKSQKYNCEGFNETARNDTWFFVSNYTYFMNENDTIMLEPFIDLVGEWNCLNYEVLTWIGKYFVRENVSLDVNLCPDPLPTKAPTDPPTTTIPPTTETPTTRPPYVLQTREPYAIWWYAQRGVYTITLNVSNPVHWVVVSKTVVIQRSVEDLVLSDHGPRSRNTTIEFELNTGNVGTDVCYFVDFKDVTSDFNHLAFWGHRQTCEARYPLEFKDEFLRFEEVSNVYLEGLLFSGQDPNITLTNVFQTVNRYRIAVVAHNMVSSETVSIPTAVTKAPCYYPEVDVSEQNGCNQYYPFCDDDGNREYYASKDVTVYARVKINCTSVKYAYYTWRGFEVSDKDGSETEIYDLGDSVMSGFTQRELAIKKFVLPYGLYAFQLNVSMYGERGVETLDKTRIRVKATPLIARITGGSEIRVRWNDKVYMDGLSETIDPDVDPSDKSGIRYVWMCRREHEAFQEWNEDYTKLLNDGYNAKDPYIVEPNDYGGCFGRFGFDRGGIGSILNFTEGAFTLDTFYMHENMTYFLKLIVFKGDRMTTAVQEMQVASGNPPKMAIACRTNCKTKLNPTSRFALESADLDARRGQILYYRWEIFKQEYNPVSLENEFVIVPKTRWLQYAGTGDSNANIAIDAGPFEDQSTYRIRVYAARTPSLQNYGLASYDFITNERPVVGNCSAVPPNGTALETEFNIECQDWTDPDMPLNYRFAQRLQESESWTWLYNGERSYMATPTVFPQGYEENNFEVFLLVRVTDYIGSFSDLLLTVEVRPPSVSNAEQMEMMQNMTGDDGVMSEAIANGDTSTAANIIAACSGMLNVAATSSSTSSEAYTMATTTFGADVTELTRVERQAALSEAQAEIEAQAQQEAEGRQAMRDSMVVAMSLAIPNTVGAMKQLSSAMVTATSSTGEVSTSAAQDTLSTSSQFMGLLAEKSDESGADEVEESSNGILNMIGNAMSGAQGKVAAAKAAASSVSSQLDYLYATGMPDVDDMESSDYYSSDVSDLEAQAAAASAEVEAMNQLSRDMNSQMNSVVGNMMGTVNGGMVTGQAPVAIASPAVNITMDKAFTANMDNKQYGAKCGSGFKLPMASTMFGSGNGSASSVDAQSLMEKTNSKTWSNNSNTVQGETAALSFNNATGGSLEIKDLAEPIEVWIQRSEDQIDVDSLVTIYNVTKPRNERMLSHVLMAPGHSALHIEAIPLHWNGTKADNVTLELYIRMGRPPSIDIYDFNCTLPHPIPNVGNGTGCGELDYPDPDVCFLSNTILDSYFNGSTAHVYVGLKSIGGANESSIDEYLGADADINTAFWPVHYRIRPFTSKCQFYDEENDEWATDGCEVGENSRLLNTQCFCTHLTSFGGGFEVPMNSIDLSQSAFTKLNENPVVFVFMVCMFSVYLTVVLWAYKKDQRDLVKAGATPLIDNDPRDHYNYEITVFTGMRSGASTTAKVSLIITGEAEESRPRLLIDPKRRTFQRGGIDSFIMSAPRHLGNLMHVRIWHDNSGKFPSWALSRLVIKDLENDKMYYFMCDRWLAVEEDDGQIERVIPVAGKSELTGFGYLFYSKTRRNLTDGHLWFSVFARPARSTFTRCQRALCCLSLLFSSMMANIFFYGIDVTSGSGGGFTIGPISVSIAEITVGVISSLMVFPANLIVVQMFRLSKPPPDQINWWWRRKKKPATEEAEKTQEEIDQDKQDRMDEKAEDELGRQLDFLNTGDDSKRLLKSARSRTIRFQEDNKEKEEEEKAKAEEDGEKKLYGKKSDDGMHLVAGLKKTEKKKKKEKFALPWQCVIIGWIVGYGTVGVAFWLTVEVAGGFGPEKATEWLKSICFSLVQDILFSQPIKVLCLATFFALVIKKPDKEDESKSPALQEDEEYVHERLTEDELKDPEKLEQLEQQKLLCPVKPPDEDTLNEMRETRFKELQMMDILKEISVYMFYLYIMFLISYGSRDQNSFGVLQSVTNTFTGAQYHGIRTLDNVASRENAWQYFEETLIPSLYPGNHYNGQPDLPHTQQKFITDRSHVLLGSMRLRQVRVYAESCKVEDIMKIAINHCTDEYSAADDDEDSYHPGWLPVNYSDPINLPNWENDRYAYPWKYRDWLELDSYPAMAEQYIYYGGGFTVEFGNNFENDMAMLTYLQDTMWIDQQTRAVFIEFTVYNPTTNIHVVSLCVIEFTPTGGATPFSKYQTMTLDHYYGPFAYFVMGGEVIFVILQLYYTIRELRKIKKEKKAYFKSPWNVIEVISIGFASGALTSYFYRLLQANSLMSDFREDNAAFHNFQYLAMWDDVYTTMVGLLLFLATIKFIRLLRFNKNMLLLTDTLTVFGYELALFMIMFFVVYLGFSSFAFLVFYKLKDYSSFLRTLESLFGTLLGKFDFVAMLEVDRYLGPLFFFLYVVVVMWIMINMLLAIINESFALVKAANVDKKNELEIVDFMIARFKKFTGINQKRTEDKRVKKQEYIEGKEQIQVECDDLKFKLDEMVGKLNDFIKVEKKSDRELFSKELEDDDKPRVIYLG